MDTSGSDSPRTAARDKPAGAAAVRESILDAAIRLMGERGSTDVALREIAREANVNHGLVHRHFGTRQDVLIAVLRRQSEVGADFLRDAENIHAAIDRLWEHPKMAENSKLVASALLGGVEPESIAPGHAFRRLEQLLEADDCTDEDRRAATAVAISCLILGWGIFGDYLTANAGAKHPERLRAQVLEILHGLSRDRPNLPGGQAV